jgi:hypothetical protein
VTAGRAIVTALALGLAAAAPARAATVAVNAPCFREGDPIGLTGNGFTPGAPVNYAFDGVGSDSGTADAAGNVSQQIEAPVLPSGTIQHTYNFTATDQANLANVATTPVLVTALTATISPTQARPSRKIKFNVRGMPPGVQVYLHYVFHGRSRGTVSLGKPAAPCGTLSVKRRFFPFNHPKVGVWTFQFDNAKRYSSSSRPAIRGKVQIYRVFRSSSARASMLR